MSEAFKQIDIHKANDFIVRGKATIVDIRDPQSYSMGHIKDAVLVNDENIDVFLQDADKNKPLICYCYHGNNSQSASVFFADNGFKEVYSIVGGFEEYKQAYS